jgi:hypothetical protein
MIGDHIRALKSGRWVHAIDCGDETVLHVPDGGPEAAGARVLHTYRPAFLAGAEAVEVIAHRERVYPAKAVVARAWSPIRDPALASMFRDSAAFAEWCKTGRLPDAPQNLAIAVSPTPGAKRGAPEARRSSKPVRAKAAPRKASPARKPARKPAARKPARKPAARKPARKPAAKRRPAPRKAAKRRRR